MSLFFKVTIIIEDWYGVLNKNMQFSHFMTAINEYLLHKCM